MPYYVMIMDDEIIKIHGSSIVSNYTRLPKWVCCQNMVKSTVTGRKMAKVIMPINDELLPFLKKNIFKKADNIDKTEAPRKLTFKDIPKAYLRFLRSKNHNENLKSLLKTNKVYLEQEEEMEVISYFFLEKKNKAQNANSEPSGTCSTSQAITNMHNEIIKLAINYTQKCQILVSISRSTRMHINENGSVEDILGSGDFLSFVLKTIDKQQLQLVDKAAENAKIQESEYLKNSIIQIEKTFVNAKNRAIALRLYNEMKIQLENRAIGIFPVKGGGSVKGARFNKWTVEINWFEGPKQPDAIVRFS